MAFAFERLQVYQKAIDFADEISSLTETFPRGFFFLADQMSRASLCVAANIAEGNGRFTKADRKNFFGISRGSVQECVPLLELARRRGLLDEARGWFKRTPAAPASVRSVLMLTRPAPRLLQWRRDC